MKSSQIFLFCNILFFTSFFYGSTIFKVTDYILIPQTCFAQALEYFYTLTEWGWEVALGAAYEFLMDCEASQH